MGKEVGEKRIWMSINVFSAMVVNGHEQVIIIQRGSFIMIISLFKKKPFLVN